MSSTILENKPLICSILGRPTRDLLVRKNTNLTLVLPSNTLIQRVRNHNRLPCGTTSNVARPVTILGVHKGNKVLWVAVGRVSVDRKQPATSIVKDGLVNTASVVDFGVRRGWVVPELILEKWCRSLGAKIVNHKDRKRARNRFQSSVAASYVNI